MWTAIGIKLEVEGKAIKLNLKKLYKKFEEIYISFYACYFRMCSSELSKQIWHHLKTPYQEKFVELSFFITEQLVNDKFDQIYENEEQCPEYALTEGILQEDRLIT